MGGHFNNGLTVLRPVLHRGPEFRLVDNSCCPSGLGEADGEKDNGWPMQRAAVTDSTGTEGPKNAWSHARATDAAATTVAYPHLTPPHHLPWCPATGRRHLQRQPIHVRRARKRHRRGTVGRWHTGLWIAWKRTTLWQSSY